jgi:hypothetical protein
LPFTTNPRTAARIGKLIGHQLRAAKRMQLPVNDIGLFLQPYKDLVTIAFANASICDGIYEVTAVDMAEVGAVLTLKAYTPEAY